MIRINRTSEVKQKTVQYRKVIQLMKKQGHYVSLYYAHQKRTLTGQYVNLSYEGNFGFQTSVSERKLFRNRKKGLREAITLAFDHISS